MARKANSIAPGEIDELYGYRSGPNVVAPIAKRQRKRRGPPRRNCCADQEWNPKITHDWPYGMAVSEVELDVFEAHFGAFIDELLSSKD